MNSLFRIDRNSIHSSEIETAGMVVIPGFHELTEDQRTEKEQPKVRDAKQEDPIDAKKAELNRLERQVEEVKEQAAQMIADAQSKADGIVKEAKDTGYIAGIEKAQAELKKEIEREQAEFFGLKRELIAAKDEMLKQMEDSVLDLSLCIAEKVVKETLDRNDKVFLNIVMDTLSSVREQSNIVLKVSKKEFELFFADDSDEFTALLKSSGIRVKQDISVESGECVIETDFGAIRSGIRMQHERITDALYEADGA